MAKLAQNFAKYMIHAKMNAKGMVERPDVIGAIFGQTEGLLGADLDLRELQHTGRIGRIEVNLKASNGKSFGEIILPSSLDASETSLIAATLETIDKVGPCDAEIEVMKVEDVRSQKRQYVIERAKDILRSMMDSDMPDTMKIAEMIKESVRTMDVQNYHGLSAGPELLSSEEIIIVEGRADVVNLLRNGLKNVIAIEGSKIPDAVIDLTRQKTTTAFLDGDRGGDLDLKKLLVVADVDFVSRAPIGKEVEELTKKEIFKCLRDKVPMDQSEKTTVAAQEAQEEKSAKSSVGIDEKMKSFLASALDDLVGTRAAYLIDKNMHVLTKIPLSEINDVIGDFRNVHSIVFDGKVNQDIVDLAASKSVPCIVAVGYKEKVSNKGVSILTPKDLR
ncbi:MAG: DNA primase [Candidatus Aenigmarchaeota archaeon]|nr:DNA primase [Candidatus Aenigmarchaeota archaeon]